MVITITFYSNYVPAYIHTLILMLGMFARDCLDKIFAYLLFSSSGIWFGNTNDQKVKKVEFFI